MRTRFALAQPEFFLFIVGVKRKHRLDAEREVGEARERAEAGRR